MILLPSILLGSLLSQAEAPAAPTGPAELSRLSSQLVQLRRFDQAREVCRTWLKRSARDDDVARAHACLADVEVGAGGQGGSIMVSTIDMSRLIVYRSEWSAPLSGPAALAVLGHLDRAFVRNGFKDEVRGSLSGPSC